MRRSDMLARLDRHEAWDIVVIGGGATGVGIAVDAASRGYDVLLVEQHDFGKGTSSRSTKLVHGGVRYLEQGNIALVMEALKERPSGDIFRAQAQALDQLRRELKVFTQYGAGFQPSLPRDQAVKGRVLDEPARQPMPGYEAAVKSYYETLSTTP